MLARLGPQPWAKFALNSAHQAALISAGANDDCRTTTIPSDPIPVATNVSIVTPLAGPRREVAPIDCWRTRPIFVTSATKQAR